MSGVQYDQELVTDFINETNEILDLTYLALHRFIDDPDPACFEDYGQGIDRVMGAALILGFTDLGNLAKLGKEVGYKSSQIKDINQLLVIHSLLSQLNKEIVRVTRHLQFNRPHDSEAVKILIKKLQRASDDLGDLRASVKIE
jgi:hypothetical protein